MTQAPREIVDTPEEAAEQELAPLIVRRPLEAFLDRHGIGQGEIEAERIGEGHSNLTYLIRRGDAEVVLRRPPRPPLPPSAHDVLREARLLLAVQDSGVRTPPITAVCDDPEVLGVPFYVMPLIEGEVITSEIPAPLDTPEQRARIGEELVDTLAEIHALDFRAVGLEGYGKPTGYLERQLRRFGGLWEHNKTRELPVLDEVTEWLGRNLPESAEATIVHGDYRLGNVMFAPEAPARLIAIFDWELSTIGDPLADLGYMTATYIEPDGDDPGKTLGLSSVTQREGFPSRAELIARYEEKTGRSMQDVRWYQTLALWKSVIFLEGSYKRLLAGTTDDAWFKELEWRVPALAEAARDVSRQPAPRA